MSCLSPVTCNLKPNKGFTLIELLVATMVVIILGGIVFVTLNQSLVKSRDNKRKADMRSLVAALEIYYQKQNHFPYAVSWQTSADDSVNPWIKDNYYAPAQAMGSSYIDPMPHDPKVDGGNPVTSPFNVLGYAYLTPPAGSGCPALGQYFILAAGLESTNDGDADGNKNGGTGYQVCYGDLISRPGSNAYVITSQ